MYTTSICQVPKYISFQLSFEMKRGLPEQSPRWRVPQQMEKKLKII